MNHHGTVTAGERCLDHWRLLWTRSAAHPLRCDKKRLRLGKYPPHAVREKVVTVRDFARCGGDRNRVPLFCSPTRSHPCALWSSPDFGNWDNSSVGGDTLPGKLCERNTVSSRVISFHVVVGKELAYSIVLAARKRGMVIGIPGPWAPVRLHGQGILSHEMRRCPAMET